jgi:hypothetical protein
MEPVFIWMMVAAVLHFAEEYIFPGGFLAWLGLTFPKRPLTYVEAIVINAAFFALVLSPFWAPPKANPVVGLSIPALLLANGLTHVVGTVVTRRYCPGVVTAMVLYFPISAYALATLSHHWQIPFRTLILGILLGFGWQLVPLARLGFSLRKE